MMCQAARRRPLGHALLPQLAPASPSASEPGPEPGPTVPVSAGPPKSPPPSPAMSSGSQGVEKSAIKEDLGSSQDEGDLFAGRYGSRALVISGSQRVQKFSGSQGIEKSAIKEDWGNSQDEGELITGSHAVGTKEAQHLATAARASKAWKKLRQKTQLLPEQADVTPKKPARKGTAKSQGSSQKSKRLTPKAKAARGTAGTFCGRRLPTNPEHAAEFAAIRDAYYTMRTEKQNQGTPRQRRNWQSPVSISNR